MVDELAYLQIRFVRIVRDVGSQILVLFGAANQMVERFLLPEMPFLTDLFMNPKCRVVQP